MTLVRPPTLTDGRNQPASMALKTNSPSRKVFFIEWDEAFLLFLKGVRLSRSLRGTVAVHIFFPSDLESSALPPYRPWILKHPVLTKSRGGLWRTMTSYVSCFKFDANGGLTEEIRFRGHGNEADFETSLTTERGSFYILTPSFVRSEDLAKNVYKERGIRMEVIDSDLVPYLLDFLSFKCDICKIAFKSKGEIQQHDQTVHGLTCLNASCQHNKRENAFKRETDLRKHIGSQLRCDFCPTKVFCSAFLLGDHMRSTHKQCGCGCRKFFACRTAYLDHFFSTYPSSSAIHSPPRHSGHTGLSKCNHPGDVNRGTQLKAGESSPGKFVSSDENADITCSSSEESEELPDTRVHLVDAWLANPFQYQEWSISKFPCSLTRNITSHTMLDNLAFHSLLRRILYHQLSSTYTFLCKRLGECTFWIW